MIIRSRNGCLALALLAGLAVTWGTGDAQAAFGKQTTTNSALTVPNVVIGTVASLGTLRISDTAGSYADVHTVVDAVSVTLPTGTTLSGTPIVTTASGFGGVTITVGGLTAMSFAVTLSPAAAGGASFGTTSDLRILVSATIGTGFQVGPLTVTMSDTATVIAPASNPVSVTVAQAVTQGLVLLSSGAPNIRIGAIGSAGEIVFTENVAGGFQPGETLTISLPAGVTLSTPVLATTAGMAGGLGIAVTAADGATSFTLAFAGAMSTSPTVLRLQLSYSVGAGVGAGPLAASVATTACGGGCVTGRFVPSQMVTNATAVVGQVNVSLTEAVTRTVIIGFVNQLATNLRFRESIAGAFANGRTIVLTLPAGVRFSNTNGMGMTPSGGAAFATVLSGNNAILTFTSTATVTGDNLGTIDLTNLLLDIDTSVAAGPVPVTLSGTAPTAPTTVAIASASSGGTTASLVGSLLTITSGGAGPATPVVVNLVETGPGVLSPNKIVTLTAPAGVRFGPNDATPFTPAVATTNGLTAALAPITATPLGGSIQVNILTASVGQAGTLQIAGLTFSTGAAVATGALNLTIGGNAGATAGPVQVATVRDATTNAADGKPAVFAGVQNQVIATVTVVENFAGAILALTPQTCVIDPPGITIAANPTFTLTAGNLGTVTDLGAVAGNVISWQHASASSVAGSLTISGARITVPSNVPAGDVVCRWTAGQVTARASLPVAVVQPLTRSVITAPANNATATRGTTLTIAWSQIPDSRVAFYGLEYTGTGLTFANPLGATPDPANGFGGAGGGFLLGTASTTTLAFQLDSASQPGAYMYRIFGLGANLTVPTGLTASDAQLLTIQ